MDLEQIADTWLDLAVKAHRVGSGLGIGDRSFELLHDGLGIIGEVDAASIGLVRLRHFR